MKYVAIVLIGIAFLAITIMTPADTWSNPSEAAHFSPSDWMNPDGRRGVSSPRADSKQPAAPHAWTNPDGTHGVAQIPFGEARANYSWVNPDGHQEVYDQMLIRKSGLDATEMAISR
jgi:hypothetical protein